MASTLPVELWLNVISSLPHEDAHFRLKYVNKEFHDLIGGTTIRRLPLPIWETVFEYLDYLSLLNVGATCKSFRGLIKYSKSRRILAATFREPLLDEAPPRPDTVFTFHPILEYIRVYDFPARVFTCRKRSSSEILNIYPSELLDLNIAHPVMSQNITSPPTRRYKLNGLLGNKKDNDIFALPPRIFEIVSKMRQTSDIYTLGPEWVGQVMGLRMYTREKVGSRAVESGITDQSATASGQRNVEAVEKEVVLSIEITAEVLLDAASDDDEREAERNASLLLMSMLGIGPYADPDV
ncbi:hypothetical protein TWF281_004864 [Arthrobotrys megalospora]